MSRLGALSIAISLGLLLAGIFCGWSAYRLSPNQSDPAGAISITMGRDRVVDILQHSDENFSSILVRNLKVLALLIFGCITGGLLDAGVLISNGFGFGWFLREVLDFKSKRAVCAVCLLLPHAVPELLGVVLAASIGIRVLVEFLAFLKHRNSGLRILWREVVLLAAVSCILILSAAWIEAYLSPSLAIQFGVK
jgi:uncharacterized membrane protein SpoIIM required for sporulation